MDCDGRWRQRWTTSIVRTAIKMWKVAQWKRFDNGQSASFVTRHRWSTFCIRKTETWSMHLATTIVELARLLGSYTGRDGWLSFLCYSYKDRQKVKLESTFIGPTTRITKILRLWRGVHTDLHRSTIQQQALLRFHAQDSDVIRTSASESTYDTHHCLCLLFTATKADRSPSSKLN